MDYRSLRIIFLGTPEFARASLEALVVAGCNIVGVITAPDKPAGRGMKLTQSAVKEYAVSRGLHVLQPEKLKNPVFLEELRALKADLQLVVAFRMLPEVVWNMPPMGTVNLHGSLLPDYRGAAPINWAIINGEKFTGQQQVKEAFEKVFETFPDAHWDNPKHFVSGNRGFSEWIFRGTKPDGKKVEVTGCDLFTFNDGKIAIKNSYRKNRLPTQ